jgi:hypothetical protein
MRRFEDVIEVTLFFASFPSMALTGQSTTHGWYTQ